MGEFRTPVRMLSVVMPVYNEQGTIEKVVLDHVDVLERQGSALESWEIVCVDDGSKDRTPEILRDLQQRVPQLRVIRQENQGIFGAIVRVYKEARGSHVYATGSDGQWPAENLEILLGPILAGAELVIGVRSNKREVYTPARRLISASFRVLPRLLFGARVEDAGSNKLGIREVFNYPLISRSVFFEAERILVAQRKKLRVEFVPIRFLARSEGKAMGASWKNLSTSLMDLLRCLKTYGFR